MDRKAIKDLLRILREDPKIAPELPILKRMVLSTFSWLFLTELFMVLQVFPVKYFIDELSRPHPNRQHLLLLAFSIMVVYKLGAELRRHMSAPRNSVMWRMWKGWWGYGHRRELRLSVGWHTAHSTGDKESLVAKNIAKFESLIDEFLFETIPVTLRIVFYSVGMFFLGWIYGIVAFGTLISYLLILRITEKRLEPLRKDFRRYMKKLERFGTELTKNWRTIKAYGMEERLSNENDEMLTEHWRQEIGRHQTYTKYMVRQDDVITVSRGLLYAAIAVTFVPGASIGSIFLATSWMERAYSNYGRYENFQRRLNEGLESMRELIELLRMEPDIAQPEKPIWPDPFDGSIEFKDVTFTYPEAKQPAIRNFNLKVPANQTVALVGFSGGGKSTIAALLQREHDPEEGSVNVGGVDLRKLDYHRFRQEGLAVVSQDVELFDSTIRQNISIVRPGATKSEIEDAAKRAHAHEFIMFLDDGYDTLVGEDGIRLSGGQKQRLAIARALLRNPRILILDEATSALDAVSQQHVQLAIDEQIASRQLTIVVIAHRFSTIMSADQVVVLHNGEIAEQGTHEELAQLNGLYRKLRDLETSGMLGA